MQFWHYLSQRLYLRIWLAVVSALIILTLLASWLWQLDREREQADRPGREIIIYNAQGEVLGQAPARPVRMPGQGGPLEFKVVIKTGETLMVQLPRPRRPPHVNDTGWRLQSMGFGTLLTVMALAVALGAYPVVRWLTKRLERLQQGVERWGDGDLSARIPVQGHDEIAFLATRFNHAAERVQALVNAHKVLLANTSHELRSPLARIRMGLALMEGASLTESNKQQAEIARNIAELDQLIDELLLASRLDSAQAVPLQLEEVDLTGLAAEECARIGASLLIEAQPLIDADPRLMRRLLRNLLENARRYGLRAQDDESAIELTLTKDWSPQGKPLACITVDDRGPGVPTSQRERIFEPFYRIPGSSEKEGSVGLGLSLVQSIVRQHSGRVVCMENPAGGARFRVELPSKF
jgi:signal transduction histidine kinase